MPHKKFFGTDGIRGKVSVYPLVPTLILKLGLAAGSVLGNAGKNKTIVIGRDTRASGPMLQSALTTGLLASGMTVIDVGVITTPGVAHLVRRMKAAAGVVISASHNPASENGIKFFDQSGFKLPEAIESEIERLLADEKWQASPAKQFGHMIDGQQMQEFYIESLLDEHPGLDLSPYAILLDCANGAASQLGPECLGRMGARLISIHASPTGSNINDQCGSEFARKNPQKIGQLLQEYQADFAIAFDGDADRVVFVDEDGNLVDGDHMLALLACYFYRQGNLVADSLVTTPMRNQGMVDFATTNGLSVHEVPVGDRNVVEKLLTLRNAPAENNAYALGAEQSGHIAIVDDEHTTGDGIRSALFLLHAFSESGAKSFTEFTSILKKTPQVIASAFVGDGQRISKEELTIMSDEYLARYPALTRINLRYSGTEPLFRAMLEGDLTLEEQDLANLAGEIGHQAQTKANVKNGKLEIINTTRGGILIPQKLSSE